MEFSKKDIKSIAEALRKPGGLVPATTPRASMVSASGVHIEARILIRLEVSM